MMQVLLLLMRSMKMKKTLVLVVVSASPPQVLGDIPDIVMVPAEAPFVTLTTIGQSLVWLANVKAPLFVSFWRLPDVQTSVVVPLEIVPRSLGVFVNPTVVLVAIAVKGIAVQVSALAPPFWV
jgi:hypothetical protein